MDPSKQSVDRMREIFIEARALPEGSERDDFLSEACGGDDALRKEVDALLKACRTTGGFLSRDAVGESLVNCTDLVGITIGHYHLEELLGEGGFGEVYRAEQLRPLRREVALKIVKLGMDTKEVLVRFEAERQALAQMDHPNIAQVYDAGVTESGRPYFVMELVRGIPLIEYCDQFRLSLPERIRLFRQVCDGVQHAHQKGILHRDLKPGNILVGGEDGKPLPKVIDFGVAKSLETQLTDQTLVTMQEMVLGTPMYMSPEQLGLEATNVDTRTDIFSLGIILYELAAGVLPLDGMKAGAIADVRRIYETTDLPRPSRQFHALVVKSEAIAHARKLRPQALYNLLHGDLDWVVMRAIERERDRRYPNVGALAQDLGHYIKHEPVSAGPPGMIYRSRKFFRRHRFGLIVFGMVFILLGAGAWVSSVAFLRAWRESERARLHESRAASAVERAEQQEKLADAAATQARRNKSLADASQQRAVQESERALREEQRAALEAEQARRQKALAEATFGFLADELLLRADPSEEPDRDIKLRTVVDQAAERLESHLKDQPLEKARIHQMLGNLYLRLAEYSKAVHHAGEAVRLTSAVLGPNHLKSLDCLHDQAEILSNLDEYQKAASLFRNVAEKRTDLLGSEHPDTLRSQRGLTVCLYGLGEYDEAEEQLQAILEVQQKILGPEHPESLETLYNLAMVLYGRGVYVKAEVLHREVLEARSRVLGKEHPATLGSMDGLARVLKEQGRYDEALELHRSLFEVQHRVFGSEHAATLATMHGHAKILCARGRYAEAESLYRKLIEIRQKQNGAEHPQTLLHMRELADVLRRQGAYGEAEQMCRSLSATWEKIRDEEHPETLDARHALAHVLAEQEQYGEAEILVSSELTVRRKDQGPTHHDTLEALELMASILRSQGRYVQSEKHYGYIIKSREQTLGADHPETLAARYQLALTLHLHGMHSSAETQLRGVVNAQERALGSGHPQALKSMGVLASTLRAQRKDKEAGNLEQRILELHRSRKGGSGGTN